MINYDKNREELINTRKSAEEKRVKTIIRTMASLFVFVIVFVIGMNSWTVVPEGKEKAGATFGVVHEKLYNSGFYVVNPIASFMQYDLQEMTYNWDDIGVPAQDNLKTFMDVHVTGHFMPTMARTIREKNGGADNFFNAQVSKRVRATVIEVGKELAKDSQAFYGETMMLQMEDLIVIRLNEELNPRGYNVTAVKFSDIRLPKVVTSAIIKTKEATQKVNTQQALLDIQQKQAQETVNTATANAEAKEQDAIGRRFAADALLYEMTQEAAGNKALASSVTSNLIKLKQANAELLWNGVRSTHVLGADSQLLMQLNK